jgi:glycosyltransferase involved in cell wall biosynthesis
VPVPQRLRPSPLNFIVRGLDERLDAGRFASTASDSWTPMPTDRSAWRLLVVVPAFNEERNIAAVVEGLRSAAYDVLVVDDGSRDRTAAVAAASGARVVRLPLNLGVGGALRCGFRFAVDNGYGVVVQCDGDGQHVPEEIHTLLLAMEAHQAHLVIGSRFAAAGDYAVSGSRRFAMRVLCRVASRRTRVRLTDTTSGFRAIRQPLLGAFADVYPSQYLGDTFEALVGAGTSGYRVVEVPVQMRERASGSSSASVGMSARYVLRAVLTVLLGSRKRYAPYIQAASD